MSDTLAFFSEVERLAEETSRNKRREMLDAITDVFLVTVNDQTDSDNEILSDLMERVGYALEIEARAHLSERVSKVERISHRLIVRLANDEISVARPVLEHSPVLTEMDLIDIIRKKSQEHLHSIAGRELLPLDVSDELVERGDDATLARLTNNQKANISTPGFGKIAERAHKNTELKRALDGRTDVPRAIIDMVRSKVGGRVKAELAHSHPDVDDKFVAALIEQCAETIELDYSDDSIEEIERLHRMNAITEETLTRYAREKRIAGLVYALSLLTELDEWSVAQCLLKAELPALAILCKAHKFTGRTFLALADTRSGNNATPASGLARAMRDYEALSPRTAERVMRYLKYRLSLNQQKAMASGAASGAESA